MKHWLDAALVEFYSRARRGAVRRRLESLSRLPRTLHIEGTNVCNARCVFCAYPQMGRPKQTMPMDDFRRVVDEYVLMGGRHVSLTPIVGDPLVDRFFFERLDDLHRRPQIRHFSFYTNAILLTSQVSARLMTYGRKLTVNVSWGGFDRQTYQRLMGVDKLDEVYDNVRAFIEHKRRTDSAVRLAVALRCAAADCRGEVWDGLCAFEREGLLGFTRLDEYDSWAGKITAGALASAGLRPRRRPRKRGACELLVSKPVVLADGRVNACACRDVEAELIIGDLHGSSLAELLAGDGINQLIERHERGDYPDVCRRCTYYVSIYNRRKSSLFKSGGNWQDE